jgi:hypothetical protein
LSVDVDLGRGVDWIRRVVEVPDDEIGVAECGAEVGCRTAIGEFEVRIGTLRERRKPDEFSLFVECPDTACSEGSGSATFKKAVRSEEAHRRDP